MRHIKTETTTKIIENNRYIVELTPDDVYIIRQGLCHVGYIQEAKELSCKLSAMEIGEDDA